MVQSKVTKLLAAAALCAAASAHAFTPSEANETSGAGWSNETRPIEVHGAADMVYPASVSESAPAQITYIYPGSERFEDAGGASQPVLLGQGIAE